MADSEVVQPIRMIPDNQIYIEKQRDNSFRFKKTNKEIDTREFTTCEICKINSKNPDAHLFNLVKIGDCESQCSTMTQCDNLCQNCDVTNPKKCHHCNDEFDGMVLENDKCRCYSERPYLNLKTKTCVEKCPASMAII